MDSELRAISRRMIDLLLLPFMTVEERAEFQELARRRRDLDS